MKRLFSGYTCRDEGEALRRLAAWFKTEPGQTLAALEQQQLDALLSNLFGYHLLQLGSVVSRDLLASSRIGHRVVMVEAQEFACSYKGAATLLRGEAASLPIESGSVDVVVMPHRLEFSASPHEVLREAERVLIPEGHLVIVGFNPWSLWGVIRLLLGWKGRPPWCGRFYSRVRISDWLALLGFDTVISRSTFFRFPVRYGRVLARFNFIERLGNRWWPSLGGIYIVVAQKRVATLTPIKPRWRPRRSLLQEKLPEATMRRGKR